MLQMSVMFGPRFNKSSDHEGMSKEGTHSFGLLMQSIIQGQQAGELREGEPLPLALMAWSQVHGLASLLVDHPLDRPGQEPPNAEQLAIFQTRLLFEGLRHPAQNV